MPPLQARLVVSLRSLSRVLARALVRRSDRGIGWAALESKQVSCLAKALAQSRSLELEGLLRLPAELLPFPQPSRRRRSLLDILKHILVWLIAIQLCYLLATGILISAYRHIDPPATVLIAYREWFFGWKVQAPRPVSLRNVPRYIRSMLISVEDGKFYEHHGLDFEAFARASEINKRVGKPLYGGSTLTMQVARTLFLVPEKSYIRKYLEVLTALELEALLPKDRILELYFGYAEWGKGIFGIEAAARKWFGRGLSALSRDEAARLIAILSSPIKYGPGTLHKNGILAERYRYLYERFVRPTEAPEEAPAEVPAPASADPPPPSPDPGAEVDEGFHG
jgi:monofunctional biosynthetic peptidoglycan transglycosylase